MEALSRSFPLNPWLSRRIAVIALLEWSSALCKIVRDSNGQRCFGSFLRERLPVNQTAATVHYFHVSVVIPIALLLLHSLCSKYSSF